MTDDQFERIKKGLNFHSEGGVYNLCTLTETALREIIEDAVKFYEKQQEIDAEQIRALQKQNGELTDELKALRESIKDYGAGCYENGLRNGKRKLEEQIEKMKKYIKACWGEENLNDYSSYRTNNSDEFRDLVKELRNGR